MKPINHNKTVQTHMANSLLSLSNFSSDNFSKIVLILGAIAVMLPIYGVKANFRGSVVFAAVQQMRSDEGRGA